MNKKYKKLLSYIEYFEDNKNKFSEWEGGQEVEEGVHQLPFCSYSYKVIEFIETVYDIDFMDKNYLEWFEEKGRNIDIEWEIKNADLDTLRRILTYYIRQDRFCEGLLARAIEEKKILNILYRLREVILEQCN